MNMKEVAEKIVERLALSHANSPTDMTKAQYRARHNAQVRCVRRWLGRALADCKVAKEPKS